MSLRDINHQAAIELGELDTEYVATLKDERERLKAELAVMPSSGREIGIDIINLRLARIKELLAK